MAAKFQVGDLVRLKDAQRVVIFEIIGIVNSDYYPEYYLEPIKSSPNKILVAYEDDIKKINSKNIELLRILFG